MDLNDNKVLIDFVERCLKGDRQSQKKLYEMFYGKMLSACSRYAENRDEAKDMLHDGFIKVFLNLDKYNFKGSLEGWIRRIIVNTAIDYTRKKKTNYSDFENEPSESEDESQAIIEIEKANQIKAEIMMELIQKLSPAYRTVFNMFVLDSYTHKEISEELGISEGTSKSNLSKAKLKLKKLFDEYLDERKDEL